MNSFDMEDSLNYIARISYSLEKISKILEEKNTRDKEVSKKLLEELDKLNVGLKQ